MPDDPSDFAAKARRFGIWVDQMTPVSFEHYKTAIVDHYKATSLARRYRAIVVDDIVRPGQRPVKRDT